MSSQGSPDRWATTPADAMPKPNPLPTPAAEITLAAGDRLGSYQLLERLGKGGMGVVFRARHAHLKKNVAVKVLSPRLARDREAIGRFEREIEALGRLEHANLVRATDAGVENGMPFVVMELLEGMDLSAVTEQHGRWPIAEACEAARQAAMGLQHAFERGMAHRDIKPSNLWLTPTGVVKVLDLGLARLFDEGSGSSALTALGVMMGTPDYMAPEQILDSHSADIRSDLYSLGCTLYHLLTGEPPFGASTHPTLLQKNQAHLSEAPPNLRQRRPDVPEGLAAVLARLLAKRPEDRYQTPAEAAAALEPFVENACGESLLGGDGPSTATVSTRTGAATPTIEEPRQAAPTRPNRFSRPWYWGAAVVAVLAGVVLAWLVSGSGTKPTTNPSPPNPTPTTLPIIRLTLDVLHRPAPERFLQPAKLGEEAFDTRFGDAVTVTARMTPPAYGFLIAFRPDGKMEGIFPDEENQAPQRKGSMGAEYELNDGAGLEAFAAVVSSQPLPSFKDWRARSSSCPWDKFPATPGLVWRGTGVEDVEDLYDSNRGKPKEITGRQATAKLADWLRLRTTQGVEMVQVLSFTVTPKENR